MKKRLDLSVGTWKSKEHYSVVGDPQSFYVYINYEYYPHSNWIKGKEGFRLFHELKTLHAKDKTAFVAKLKEVFEKNKKG